MKQRELFILSVTVFLTIVAWVLFDLNSLSKKITIRSNISQFEQVDFSVKSSIVENLKQRKQ